MLRFEPFSGTLDDWDAAIAAFPGLEIYHTASWIRFLAESQRGVPILADLKDGNDTVGRFAGLIVKRWGMKILGSPFVGWTTERMGVHLLPGVPRRLALQALTRYAFRDLGCVHCEFSDSWTTREDVEGLGFRVQVANNSFVDLAVDEEQIYHNMNRSARRYCNRKGDARGISVEECCDDAFANEYFEQLEDVFAHQGLVPTFDLARVRSLIKHLLPTGDLLLLRTRNQEGACLATGMFFGKYKRGHFWGNASWHWAHSLRPNESLHWRAMMHYRARGALDYEMGGGGYTYKYGAKRCQQLRFRISKYPWIASARNLAASIFWLYQRAAGLGTKKHDATNEGE
jgi:hypothetical protein